MWYWGIIAHLGCCCKAPAQKLCSSNYLSLLQQAGRQFLLYVPLPQNKQSELRQLFKKCYNPLRVITLWCFSACSPPLLCCWDHSFIIRLQITPRHFSFAPLRSCISSALCALLCSAHFSCSDYLGPFGPKRDLCQLFTSLIFICWLKCQWWVSASQNIRSWHQYSSLQSRAHTYPRGQVHLLSTFPSFWHPSRGLG